jgi:NADP-dependent 3-hydroxy acid dehydrogenase YdfG
MAQLLHAAAELAIAPLNWLFQLVCLLCAWVGVLQGRKRSPAPRSVLITGATSGIGEALAVHYAGAGVVLSLTGRNREALERVAALCRAKGATVATRAGDVADSPAAGSGVRNEFAAWIRERDHAAPLDLVVANAGINEDTSGADKDLEGAARAIFSVNVEGVFNTIFPALEGMRARGSGQIALMASLASFGALTGSAACEFACRFHRHHLTLLFYSRRSSHSRNHRHRLPAAVQIPRARLPCAFTETASAPSWHVREFGSAPSVRA